MRSKNFLCLSSQNSIILALQPGEKIIADRGYNDINYFDVPNGNADVQKKYIGEA